MPEIGDILADKYRLERLVGQGGMGAVYEAIHLELGKRVAVKIPHAELADKTQELRRFEREPRLAAATGHRGIVDIYDVGTTPDGLPFVVMECLQGETLAGRLVRETRLPVSVAAGVVAQVLSALDAAHRKKIVHRDLKPDNVFLIDTGQPVPEVKILDFGTSKAVGGELATDSLTKSGTVLGTPYYLAPEQIRDEESLDHRADIYAVGVMFYELLTGRRPYRAENVYTLVHKILNDDLEPPSELSRDIPAGIEEIVLRALARDPDERFASASSMLAALLPFLDDMALGRVSLPDALRRDGGRTSIVSDTTPTVETPLTATRAARPAAEARRRLTRLAAVAIGVVVVAGIALWAGLSAEGPAPSAPGTTVQSVAGRGPDAAAEAAVAATPSEAGPATTEEAVPTPADALVTLDVVGVPDGGVVFLDGARLRKTRIRVRPSREARELRVHVAGDDVLREMITLEEDTSVEVAERAAVFAARAEASRRPATKRPRAGEPPPTAEGPTAPPAGTAKRPPTKGPGLDFTDEWHPEDGAGSGADRPVSED